MSVIFGYYGAIKDRFLEPRVLQVNLKLVLPKEFRVDRDTDILETLKRQTSGKMTNPD